MLCLVQAVPAEKIDDAEVEEARSTRRPASERKANVDWDPDIMATGKNPILCFSFSS